MYRQHTNNQNGRYGREGGSAYLATYLAIRELTFKKKIQISLCIPCMSYFVQAVRTNSSVCLINCKSSFWIAGPPETEF